MSERPAGLALRPLSRAEVRGIDGRAAGELGVPTVVLMENAGRGAAAALALMERAQGRTPANVLVLCEGPEKGTELLCRKPIPTRRSSRYV
jgi:NAD(P)H-hydrate epimerase